MNNFLERKIFIYLVFRHRISLFHQYLFRISHIFCHSTFNQFFPAFQYIPIIFNTVNIYYLFLISFLTIYYHPFLFLWAINQDTLNHLPSFAPTSSSSFIHFNRLHHKTSHLFTFIQVQTNCTFGQNSITRIPSFALPIYPLVLPFILKIVK